MTIVLFQLKKFFQFFYWKFAFECLIHPEHPQLAQALKIQMSYINIYDQFIRNVFIKYVYLQNL